MKSNFYMNRLNQKSVRIKKQLLGINNRIASMNKEVVDAEQNALTEISRDSKLNSNFNNRLANFDLLLKNLFPQDENKSKKMKHKKGILDNNIIKKIFGIPTLQDIRVEFSKLIEESQNYEKQNVSIKNNENVNAELQEVIDLNISSSELSDHSKMQEVLDKDPKLQELNNLDNKLNNDDKNRVSINYFPISKKDPNVGVENKSNVSISGGLSRNKKNKLQETNSVDKEVFLGYITVAKKEETELIVSTLLETNLIACCNIFENITSYYKVDNKVNFITEYVLIIKTIRQNINKIINHVRIIHSYNNPAIVFTPIEKGASAYLEWVKNVTK